MGPQLRGSGTAGAARLPTGLLFCPPGVVCWGKDYEALGLLLDKLGFCRFLLAFSDLREVVGLRPL